MCCASGRGPSWTASCCRVSGRGPWWRAFLCCIYGRGLSCTALCCLALLACGEDTATRDYAVPQGTFDIAAVALPAPGKPDGGAPLSARSNLDLAVRDVAVMDLDGDGRDDFAFCSSDGAGAAFSRDGGLLVRSVPFRDSVLVGGPYATECAVVALAGKTGPEIAAASPGGLAMQFGMESSVPEAPMSVPVLEPGAEGSFLPMSRAVPADVDGDGAAEILRMAVSFPLSEKSDVGVLVWKRSADDTLVASAPIPVEAILSDVAKLPRTQPGDGGAPTPLVALLLAADLDGKPGVEILLGDGKLVAGAGSGKPATLVPLPVAPASPVASDLDGDGQVELAGITDGALVVWSVAGGKVTEEASWSSDTGPLTALAAADLDGKPGDEILAADGKGLGFVAFKGGKLVPLGSAAYAYSDAFLPVAAGDTDGDGKREAIARVSQTLVSCPLPATGEAETQCVELAGGLSGVWDASPADVDGDGEQDILAFAIPKANEPMQIVHLPSSAGYAADADSSFPYPSPSLPSSDPIRVSAVDLVGDGRLDVLLGSTQWDADGLEFLLPNIGGGLPRFATFERSGAGTAGTGGTTPGSDGGMLLADIDGDSAIEVTFDDGAWIRIPEPGSHAAGDAFPDASCPHGRLAVHGPLVSGVKDLMADAVETPVADASGTFKPELSQFAVRLFMYSNQASVCQQLAEAGMPGPVTDMLPGPDGLLVLYGLRNMDGKASGASALARVTFTLDDGSDGGEAKIDVSVHPLVRIPCAASRLAAGAFATAGAQDFVVACRQSDAAWVFGNQVAGISTLHLLPDPGSLPAVTGLAPAASFVPLETPPVAGLRSLVPCDVDGDGLHELAVVHAGGLSVLR